MSYLCLSIFIIYHNIYIKNVTGVLSSITGLLL
nr:MAG TPA: hypothetical protein [Caudoviricetes sp.]